MSNSVYTDETPADVKNAKGLHLITQNTPNGQAVQIFLEELKDVYGLEWTTSVIDISTNEQKKDWFLRLDPNGEFLEYLPISHRLTPSKVAFQSWLTTPNLRHSPSMRQARSCSTFSNSPTRRIPSASPTTLSETRRFSGHSSGMEVEPRIKDR